MNVENGATGGICAVPASAPRLTAVKMNVVPVTNTHLLIMSHDKTMFTIANMQISHFKQALDAERKESFQDAADLK